ncbi:MAG: MCE family protein [Gemmatimonadaceae bacterium]|nr:MCE family protein [Gemmatimonadaceae bacterium]
MKRRDEVIVGLFTIAALSVATLGAIWLARGGLAQGYPLYSRFAWGQGLKQGQPVWLSGATVGFVDRITFEPGGTLLVTYRLEDQYRVPKGAQASIMPNGFFGDVAIGLTPTVPSTEFHAEGDTIPVGPPAASLARLAANADTITQGVNTLLRGANTQLVDSGGLREVRRTMEAMNRLVVQLGEVTALQSRELQATLVAVRAKAAAVDSQQVDSTVRALRATAANLQVATAEMKTTTGELNALLRKVQAGEGTAGKLVNDPALYNDLRRVLLRVDSLTVEFRKNPRRFINLEIF